MAEKVDKVKQSGPTKHIPKDAQVIMSIMRDMDIMEYEPRVINQLLEFIYRYVACILEDAKAYANHAKKKSIDLDDVKLALSIQLEQVFTNPPPREVLAEAARTKNNYPLPLIKPHCGIRLPQDRFCLSSCNLKIKQPQFQKKGVKIITGFGVSRTQSVTMPKPVTKLAVAQKMTVKPKLQQITQIQVQPSTSGNEDESNSLKRKREDDDYDVM